MTNEIILLPIDNVLPDDVSMKSLKVLDQKLQWLASEAEFEVTVNCVVGIVRSPRHRAGGGSAATDIIPRRTCASQAVTPRLFP